VTGWVMELSSIRYLFYPMTAAAIAFVALTLFDTRVSNVPAHHE
jgi:hypothetical protein